MIPQPHPSICFKPRVDFIWSHLLLPSATKLRRLCFYRCLSVHRGRGVCLSAWWDTHPPEQTPLSRHPQEQTPPRSRHPREQTPLDQTPPEQTPPRADTPLGADTSQSWHFPELTPPPEADTPPRDGHCCGRYVSYWNAFLLFHIMFIYY